MLLPTLLSQQPIFGGPFPPPLFPTLSTLFSTFPLAGRSHDDAGDQLDIPVTIEQVNHGEEGYDIDVHLTPKYNCKPGRECINCAGDN